MEGQGWKACSRAEQADSERRLDSENTLKIELTGFGDGFEVRKERGIQDGCKVFGLTIAITDLQFTEMGETAVKKKYNSICNIC